MNTLLNVVAEIVAPIMASTEGKGVCVFTSVNSTQVIGTYDGHRLVLSRVWDNNEHHVRLWWSARCGQHSFIHSELSELLTEVLEKHQQMNEAEEEERLNKMYSAAAANIQVTVEADDQDWFI